MRTRPLIVLLGAVALVVAGSGFWRREDSRLRAELGSVPTGPPIPDPFQPVVSLELCEDWSEDVSEMLSYLAGALRSRDMGAARSHLSPAFRGSDWSAMSKVGQEDLPLGSRRTRYRVAGAPAVDADAFLQGLARLLSTWKALDHVELELSRADFQAGRPTWGKIHLRGEWVGRGADGSALTLTTDAVGQVVEVGRRWYLHALDLEALESVQRMGPMFVDVTAQAGLSYFDGALNRGYEGWNGAASGDVNGDGLWDLFIPSRKRNFLFVARPEGGFEDQASERGVAEPAGGTGAVFFDYDNDGDQDLLVADEGSRRPDGSTHGNPCRLYRNDRSADSWRFVEVGREVGFGDYRYSFAVAVLDFDQDGFLDVFLGNYGRQTDQKNNSWVDATNGQSNQLFRNVRGERFEDVTDAAGIADNRWTYAAAAADYDRDGDTDLYIVNDFGPNVLMRNNGDGTFSDVTQGDLRDVGFGMSASWADLNNDGLLDLYISNMWAPVAHRILARLALTGEDVERMKKIAGGNTILLGRDGGGFERAPPGFGGIEGRWAWASVPLDVDLDGRLDIFCTNGFMTRTEPRDVLTYFWRNVIASSIPAEEEPSILVRQRVNDGALSKQVGQLVWKKGWSYSGRDRGKLWLNRGGDGFWDSSGLSGVDAAMDGRAAIAADFDDDGDPDLFVHSTQGERHHLYRNDAAEPAGRFLKVQVRATRGQYQGVGAEVRVHGTHGPCSQVVSLGSQYLSCQPPELVFGLDGADSARVEVFWPGGAREDFGAILAGSRVLLEEGTGTPKRLPARPRPLTR